MPWPSTPNDIPRRVFPATCLLLLAAAVSGAASAAALEPGPGVGTGLTLLHQGRFDAAASAFARITKERPADPEGPLFQGLVAWWRLLDRPKDEEQHRVFEDRVAEAVRRAEALASGADSVRGKLFAGTALILSAQAHAWEKSYFSAGSAARQGHRYLEAALAADPNVADAWFALGAYKYFAAKMPWLVRTLRFFFFIPGGDAEAGLKGLRSAAERGVFFATESRLLLSYIYASENENDFRQSLDHLDAARGADPDSPLLAAVAARLKFMLGDLSTAEKDARAAIELSNAPPVVTPSIPALARLRLAMGLYYRYRPREALEEAMRLASPGSGLPDEAEGTLASLLARLKSDLGDPVGSPGDPEPRPPAEGKTSRIEPRPVASAPLPSDAGAAAAVAKLGTERAEEGLAALSAAAARHPEDVITRYHLARGYQMAGKQADAIAALRPLVDGDARLPRTLEGWALIRMGAAFEESGNRAGAEIYYRRAAELKGFIFRRAADDRLRHPGAAAPPQG